MSRLPHSNSLEFCIPEVLEDLEMIQAPTIDAVALVGYARNVMDRVEPGSDEAQALIGWMARNRDQLGLAEDLFNDADFDRGERRRNTRPIPKTRWRSFRAALDKRLCREEDRLICGQSLEAGFAAVAEALGISGLNARLFELAYRYRLDTRFERLFDCLAAARGRPGVLRRYPDLFALLIGSDAMRVNACFKPDAPLLSSGSIRIDSDGDIAVVPRLAGLIQACSLGGADVRTELLGQPMPANLPWIAFRHLGEEIEVARRIIERALATDTERGVNILLYGPPGTGKTELAAAIAAVLGVPVYLLGERNGAGEEPSRGDRLSQMLLAQRIGTTGKALYLFDEAEDLFRPRLHDREPDPKIFIHRLLETSRVPMIWAANDLTAFSPAVLRRMSLCIEVRLPPVVRRAELWQELATAEGVELDHATAHRLAGMIPAAPSVARTALRAARLAGGGAETAEMVATGMARAIGHGRAPAPETEVEAGYDPAFSNADTDLAKLADRLSREGTPRGISLLLSGPPGTGKSAFARHLAQRMGLTVLQKRGSDLFGPYVGETEARIAAAFAEARATSAFLIFDEADSLLRDRAGAQRSWEASQVNEMLTWMETHKLPFACTTNLPDTLDKASLRRFLLRITFRPLNLDQAEALFRRQFGAEPPAGLFRLDRLTPADFGLVARRVALLGLDPDPDALFSMLAEEVEGRVGAARPIGFGTER
ncbi:MAG TPA: ATP-binding protein [Acidiphilium sp.]|uniref:AAA family ATPase n=1 Tax=unclassified Acidiphilium TaxID=2617493 RepID=UPI000BD9B235|nr:MULTISPECIES: ATP-binding protein [unclassified Acidiphilium]OYV55639.1 MAG: hypothetical protein B7Z76_09285 [Acidiphilium sp. 20-67-58]HQT61409.1 ATP-binding protein [Acidiphilium sp.]HQU10150.1 ATP-binding protein [Acidiphilium sp.]